MIEHKYIQTDRKGIAGLLMLLAVSGCAVAFNAPVDALVADSATSSNISTDALSVDSATEVVSVTDTLDVAVSGGSGNYTYAVISGSGTIDASGHYTAPGSASVDVIEVTDVSTGKTVQITVTVYGALSISPTTKNIVVNGTTTFSGVGGSGQYSFSRVSGSGSINSSSGLYTAPGSAGTDVVRVTDTETSLTANATITIYGAVAISPSSKTLAVGNSFTFSGTSGSGTYSFAVVAGTGSVNSSSGLYTAPGSSGTATVRVTDTLTSATSDASVTINAALAISPTTANVGLSATKSFAGSNGVSPYAYSIFSGEGSVNPSSGLYTAPAAMGTGVATVRVTDNVGNTQDASVTLYAPGSLDTTFDTDGVQSVHFATDDSLFGIGIDGNQKIIAVGMNGTGRIVVSRLTTAGALDGTFNTTGKSTLVQNCAYPNGFAIDSNNKIIVGGFDSMNNRDFCLGRFNADGTVDNTFGGGYVTTDFGNGVDEIYGMTVDSSNKVIAVGGTTDMKVVRYNTNGSLDTSFDTDGKLTIDFNGENDKGKVVKIDSNGKILVAGYGDFSASAQNCIARLNTDGSLDTSFSGDGKFCYGAAGVDEILDMVVTTTEIWAAGTASSGTQLALAKITTAGALDATFGTAGVVKINLGAGDEGIMSLILQSDGKFLVGATVHNGSYNELVVGRLLSTGAWDTSFDSDGYRMMGIETGSYNTGVTNIVVDSNERIIFGGDIQNANWDFQVGRILNP